MSRALAISLATTDIAFLLYWSVSALYLGGLVDVPPDWLFNGYHDTRVMAWNWSFLPLDVAFSILGLMAIRAARLGAGNWRTLATASLVLSSAAGGMAVGYWILLREFEPFWFLSNLVLFAWPFLFLPRLLRGV